jgi:hypothetical protein
MVNTSTIGPKSKQLLDLFKGDYKKILTIDDIYDHLTSPSVIDGVIAVLQEIKREQLSDKQPKRTKWIDIHN